MPKNLPREVTLLSRRDFGYGSVVKLTSQGPKYWHGHAIWKEDDGRERVNDWSAQYEKEHYILLEGKQFDLVEKCRQAERDYKEACRQRDRDRERAIWEFRDTWDKTHPYPKLPKLQDLVREWAASFETIMRSEGPPYDAATATGMYDRGDIPQ